MGRYRQRRRRRGSPMLVVTLLVGASGGTWWIYFRDSADLTADSPLSLNRQPILTTDRPEIEARDPVPIDIPERGQQPQRNTKSATTTPPTADRVQSLVAAGVQALDAKDPIAARAHLSEALQLAGPNDDVTLIRAKLTLIANETIFSSRIMKGDPLVERYVIKTGDSLGNIAKANKISADLLASINNIRDKNRIRAGQTIKVIKGPIRAVVNKDNFTMDIYIGTTFLRHYRVGLGADDSTPQGTWRVHNKLINPTYYPPRGGKIVAADDPENPLGERWIGLVGVDGEAVGQERYGIHGTTDPDSIGKSISMGCIRMFNEDVNEVFTFLVHKHSTVTVN